MYERPTPQGAAGNGRLRHAVEGGADVCRGPGVRLDRAAGVGRCGGKCGVEAWAGRGRCVTLRAVPTLGLNIENTGQLSQPNPVSSGSCDCHCSAISHSAAGFGLMYPSTTACSKQVNLQLTAHLPAHCSPTDPLHCCRVTGRRHCLMCMSAMTSNKQVATLCSPTRPLPCCCRPLPLA